VPGEQNASSFVAACGEGADEQVATLERLPFEERYHAGASLLASITHLYRKSFEAVEHGIAKFQRLGDELAEAGGPIPANITLVCKALQLKEDIDELWEIVQLLDRQRGRLGRLMKEAGAHISREAKSAAFKNALRTGEYEFAISNLNEAVLLRRGWNAVQVQKFLGHSDPGFTLRTYVHLLPEDLPTPEFAGLVAEPRPADRAGDQVGEHAMADLAGAGL
jgi:hypothetical protein